MATATRVRPAGAAELAELLAAADSVRPLGGGSKQDWGGPGREPELLLETGGLDRIVAHNDGDLTAVIEAGVPLARAQERFAERGQRLSLDPPGADATLGGILATGDSGPLRHRHGGVRDLILGVRVALPDGTVARAGSDVIKNVAGYDLAKLMCGALGTLGVICEATMRLHPLPDLTLTAAGRSGDPEVLTRACRAVAARALELEALDLRWDGPEDGGCVLARAGGRQAERTAAAVAELLGAAGAETAIASDDAAIWAEQRDRQRATDGGAVVRVSTLPAQLETLLRASQSAVVRGGLGLAWVRIPGDDPDALARLRAAVPAPCVLESAPAALRAAVDPWGLGPGPELDLLRRVKARFDPRGVCNPGRYVGGI